MVGLVAAAIASFVWATLFALVVEMILRKVPMGPSLISIGGLAANLAAILLAAGSNVVVFRNRILASAPSPSSDLQ